MASRECNVCNAADTYDSPLESYVICINNKSDSYRLYLCPECLRRAQADVGRWTMYADLVTTRPAGREKQLALPLALPEAQPVDPSRKLHQVRIPARRRTVVVDEPEGDDLELDPGILNGHTPQAVQRARNRWSWAAGARQRALERNLHPVDVLIAADHDIEALGGFLGGEQTWTYAGIRVRGDLTTGKIIDAYPDQ